MEVEVNNRKSAYIGGRETRFDLDKDEHFMEVSQWNNGEGWTISITNHLGARTFELSFQELEGIKYLINKLDYE